MRSIKGNSQNLTVIRRVCVDVNCFHVEHICVLATSHVQAVIAHHDCVTGRVTQVIYTAVSPSNA